MSSAALVVLVTVLTMVPQFSTDLYMPGLPALVEELGTTQQLGTATMIVFFVSQALGMLVVGPISDSVGRKPVLIACGAVAAVLSTSCVFAQSIWFLVAVRVVHGFAAGGMTSVGMSLVKDCFTGRKLESTLAITQTTSFIAPTVAPLLGAAVLQVADWRATFAAMAATICVALAGALAMPETLPPERRRKRQEGAGLLSGLFGGLACIAKSRPHMSLTAVVCLLGAPFMCYLGIASFIYEAQFGATELEFGVFFAVASVLASVGPIVYMRTSGIRTRTGLLLAVGIECASGLCILVFGGVHQAVFFALLMPCLFMCTYIKPRVIGILLDAELAEAGATSSAFNFTQTLFGCLGMVAVNILPGLYSNRLGVAIVALCVLAALVWLANCRPIRRAIAPKEI